MRHSTAVYKPYKHSFFWDRYALQTTPRVPRRYTSKAIPWPLEEIKKLREKQEKGFGTHAPVCLSVLAELIDVHSREGLHHAPGRRPAGDVRAPGRDAAAAHEQRDAREALRALAL
jgi:hypothetical protein